MIGKFLKKLFRVRDAKVEYVGTTTLQSQFFWEKTESKIVSAVYRRFDEQTNKTLSVFSDVMGHGRVYFDTNAFDKEGRLVLKG